MTIVLMLLASLDYGIIFARKRKKWVKTINQQKEEIKTDQTLINGKD
jgi:hypothetical protein